MSSKTTLETMLRQLGPTLTADRSVVDDVMGQIAGAEFSPSLRAVKMRRWVARSIIAMAACLLIAMGWSMLNPRTTPPEPMMAHTSPVPKTLADTRPDTAAPTTNFFSLNYDKLLLATAKWGYIDTAGKVIIPAQFQVAKAFSEGRAAVKLNGRWTYIDLAGMLLTPPTYEEAGSFSNGLAAVKLNGKWGYVNTAGREAIPWQFESVGEFRDGRALVKLGGKFGYIGALGEISIPPQFTYASDFSEGLATVEVNGKRGYIDASGALLIPPQFESSVDFREGFAAVMVPGRKWRFINKTGQFAFDGEWAYATSFHEGRAMVRPKINGRYGYINARGQQVVPAIYWGAAPFSGGLAHVEENNNETGLWGYIDPMGKKVFENKRISAPFQNGLARIQVFNAGQPWPMGSFGFVDHTGAQAIAPQFEWLEEFSEGLAPFAADCDHENVRKAMATERRAQK